MTRYAVTNESETMLAEMGFSAFFKQQLSMEELEAGSVGRVLSVQRSGLTLGTAAGECHVSLGGHWWTMPAERRPTVGDWVLLDVNRDRIVRVLERKSLFKRMAAGEKVDLQLIAANVDTVFVVSSCNAEFNASRLERYLALAMDAGVDAVLVLTKADLAGDAEQFRSAANAVRRELCIELVDARDAETLAGVYAWCRPGHTIALLGSSGVGKSTLVNTLAGDGLQSTQEIRAADARGRHTTTSRSLHALLCGAWLLDSPGMRELSLAGTETGLSTLFDDIDELAGRCRFTDCGHDGEPGCAIQQALAHGMLDQRRLANYRKLQREDARSRESLAERRRRARVFARHVRRVTNEANRRRE
jgi:ribosome biogenesis GTPase / thiamine phosphate phosphatase